MSRSERYCPNRRPTRLRKLPFGSHPSAAEPVVCEAVTGTSEAIPTGNAYDKYGTSNPVERRMMAGFFAAFDGFIATSNPSSLLEVGAGEGSIARRLLERKPELSITILDLPDPELASHWAGLAVAQVQGSVEELPFSDRSMELILAIEVLEHVVRPEVALAEIARVADRDVILSVPREPIWRIGNLARGRYFSDLGNTPGHIQHWSKRSFAALVDRHFEVLSVSAPLPWTMIHARRRER